MRYAERHSTNAVFTISSSPLSDDHSADDAITSTPRHATPTPRPRLSSVIDKRAPESQRGRKVLLFFMLMLFLSQDPSTQPITDIGMSLREPSEVYMTWLGCVKWKTGNGGDSTANKCKVMVAQYAAVGDTERS